MPSVALAKAKKAVAVAASSNGKGAPAVKVMERTVDAQTAAAVERVMNEYKPMVTHESGKSIGLQMGSMLMRIVCGISRMHRRAIEQAGAEVRARQGPAQHRRRRRRRCGGSLCGQWRQRGYGGSRGVEVDQHGGCV